MTTSDKIEATFQILAATLPAELDGLTIQAMAEAIVTGDGDLQALFAEAARELGVGTRP